MPTVNGVISLVSRYQFAVPDFYGARIQVIGQLVEVSHEL